MRAAIVLLFFCFAATPVFSENISDTTYYYKKYFDHFAVSGVVKQKNFDFTLRGTTGAGNFRKTFNPNNSYSTGIALYVFDVNIELTAGIPISQRSIERFGKTSTRDLQLNLITHRLGLELYSQRYVGFYVTDPTINIISPQPFPFRPELESRNTGFSAVYIFNSKRYSLPATYNFADQQLKSSGSFIIQSSLNSWKLNIDSALIGKHLVDDFGAGAAIVNGNFTSFDLGPGYAQNIIYKGFFLNLTLFLAPSHTWIRYREDDRPNKYDIHLNFSSGVRAAVGYNSDVFFTGLSLSNQSKIFTVDDTELINNRSSIKFVLGFRFREKGIMKKSAMDLIPQSLRTH